MPGTRRGSLKLSAAQLDTLRTDGMVVGHIYPQVSSAVVFLKPGQFGTPWGTSVGLTEQQLADLAEGQIPDVPIYDSTTLTEDTVDISGPSEANT
jgi:hypothetical protein